MIYIFGFVSLLLVAVTVWCFAKVCKTDRYSYREVDDN